MEQVLQTTPRLHPLYAVAAGSVIAVSLAGIGVMTGILPTTHATVPAASVNVPVMPAPMAAMPVPPAPVAVAPVAPEAAPTPVPRTVAKAAPVVRTVYVREAAREARNDASPTLPAVQRDTSTPRRHDPYYGNEPVAQPGASGNPYGNDPYGNARGNDPYGRNPYGEVAQAGSPAAGNPYGNAPYGNAPAGTSPYGNAPYGNPQPVAQNRPICQTCGVVEAVVETSRPGEGSGLGMAGGALGGAVVGKQFGKGRGNDLMTILGAVGGAYAGNQVEKNVRSTRTYEVRVRMDDGSVRSLPQQSQPSWRAGDRVRVDGGSISQAT